MGLIDTLKWLWDPRSEEQKRYETDPLRRYTQHLTVYVKSIEEPFKRYLEFEDRKFGDWYIRVDLDDEVREWLSKRATKGIRFDNVWYPPEQVLRIELNEHTVVTIG